MPDLILNLSLDDLIKQYGVIQTHETVVHNVLIKFSTRYYVCRLERNNSAGYYVCYSKETGKQIFYYPASESSKIELIGLILN